MYMIRKNFYLTQEQSDTLARMKSLTISEHIRRAIDEYIIKCMNQNASVSPSIKSKSEARRIEALKKGK